MEVLDNERYGIDSYPFIYQLCALHCFFSHILDLAPTSFDGYEHHLQGAALCAFITCVLKIVVFVKYTTSLVVKSCLLNVELVKG